MTATHTTATPPRSPVQTSGPPNVKGDKLDLSEGKRVLVDPPSNDELDRFRHQWRNEVEAKRHDGASERVGRRKEESTVEGIRAKPTAISTSPANAKMSPRKSTRTLHVAVDDDEQPAAGPSKRQTSSAITQTPEKVLSRPCVDKDHAVQLYARAVESEQSGQINEALMLYRRAFKMDGMSLHTAAITCSSNSTERLG